MKILHIASFTGNIGDNASHSGLNIILSKFLTGYSVTRIEIRKFYKNYSLSDKQLFDSGFIDYANKFDLLIIGGGGFLDYWVAGSQSGTTIDISPDLISKLTVSTLIMSVGCIPHREVPKGNVKKFQNFLDAALSNPKVKIAIRNDGSVNSFKNEIGAQYLKEIPEILDFGFFFSLATHSTLPVSRPFVALNITNDQIGMKSNSMGRIEKDLYYSELVKVVNYICLERSLPIVIIPHIYSDLTATTKLLTRLDDHLIRNFCTVAPCIQTEAGAKYLFSLYSDSKLVLGTRFHANVCSLAMNKPTVGLVAIDRVKYLYDQFELYNSYVTLDSSFSEDLIRKIGYVEGKVVEIQTKTATTLDRLKDQTYEVLEKFF